MGRADEAPRYDLRRDLGLLRLMDKRNCQAGQSLLSYSEPTHIWQMAKRSHRRWLNTRTIV